MTEYNKESVEKILKSMEHHGANIIFNSAKASLFVVKPENGYTQIAIGGEFWPAAEMDLSIEELDELIETLSVAREIARSQTQKKETR